MALRLSPLDAANKVVEVVAAVNRLLQGAAEPIVRAGGAAAEAARRASRPLDWARGEILVGSGLEGWLLSATSIAELTANKAARKARKAAAKTDMDAGQAGEEASRAKSAARAVVLERFRTSPARALASLGLQAVDGAAQLAQVRADATNEGEAMAAEEAMSRQLSRLGRWQGGVERAVLALSKLEASDGSKSKSGAEMRRDWRRLVLSRVFPACDVLVHAIRTTLPPPAAAHRWRVPALAHPDASTDPTAKNALWNASATAVGAGEPTLAYVSRLLPPSAAAAAGTEGHVGVGGKHGGSRGGAARLLAYTRVYSGRLSAGDKVWVLDDEDAASGATGEEDAIPLRWR